MAQLDGFRRWGWGAFSLVGLLILCPIGLCLFHGLSGLVAHIQTPGLGRMIQFTLMQGGLCALGSTFIALPIARILARQGQFRGRNLLLISFQSFFLVPGIVIVMGLITLFGQQGHLNRFLSFIHVPPVSIYGLGGIVFATCLLNVPFCVLLFLRPLERIPPASWALVAQLRLSPRMIWRVLEWPHLKPTFLHGFWMFFLLCCRNSTFVLLLGNSPAHTTLEVGIYQALHMDFDPTQAGFLAILYIVIGSILYGLSALFRIANPTVAIQKSPFKRQDGMHTQKRDFMLLGLVFGLVSLPVTALVLEGVGPLLTVLGGPLFWKATLISLSLGIPSALLAQFCVLGILMASATYQKEAPLKTKLFELLGFAKIMIPSSCIGVGFIILNDSQDRLPASLILSLLHLLMILPFVTERLKGPIYTLHNQTTKSRQSLNLSDLSFGRWIAWPALKPALNASLWVSTAMVVGDVGCSLFVPQGKVVPLSLFIHQELTQGHLSNALGAALGLMIICSTLSWLGKKAL